MSAGTLVVGASQAGVQIAVTLRELGYDGPVTLVGEEPHAPYQRPPLSKSFLSGEVDADALTLRAPGFYRQSGIELIRGECVQAIRLDDHGSAGSGTATTSTGRELDFDRLALAVGGVARRIDVPGSELAGVHHLRHLTEAARLRAELVTAERLVVVGGGFIGLEAAAVARSMGKSVTVVEALDRLLARAVAPVVSEFYRAAHTRRGTEILLSTGVVGLEGSDGRVTGVALSDGRVLAADLVLVGIGLVPRTELAASLGLRLDGGILVDDCARTSNPAIVAAGDCTALPHPRAQSRTIRIESVQNALAQARVAAETLVGVEDRRPVPVPWFWSDQADLKLQIAGLSADYDHVVVRGSLEEEKFSALYYHQGQLIAVDAVNNAADYMAVRAALTKGVSLPADLAADDRVALKTLLQGSAAQH